MPEASKISLKPLFIALFIGLALATGYFLFRDQFGGEGVNSFEACVKAGNPVTDSYPEQCQSGKQTFINTDQITQ
jgi:hypothetical protein